MEVPRLRKSIVKIVQLEQNATGNLSPLVLYKKPSRKKRMSAPLKSIEKAVRNIASAQATAADKYLERHERSNQKNRDGWARDMFSNLLDAEKSGRKKLRIKRLIMN